MAAPEDMKDILIHVPPGIFLHDGSTVMLSFNDFKHFLHASGSNKWLDVGHITIFLMKLINSCQCKGKQKNLCAFLDPSILSATSVEIAPKESIQYLCGAMLQATKAKKRFILLPYHQRGHWCLVIIVPCMNAVYVVDSSQPERIGFSKCKAIYPAFAAYVKKGGLHSTNKKLKDKLIWRWWPGPQQVAGWECGYYMMISMFDFVERMQFQFPDVQPSKQAEYSKEQIDYIRCSWARWFLSEFCNAEHGFV